MADAWEEAAKKYAASPVGKDSAASASSPAKSVWDTQSAAPSNSTGDQLKEGALGFASGINPLNGMGDAIMHPLNTIRGIGQQMSGLRSRASDDFQKGNYVDAIQHGLGGVVPVVGPAASNFLDSAIPSNGAPPDMRGAGESLGQLASLKTTPLIAGALSRGLRAAAEPVMENALGIRNVDRAPGGKMPGRAALDMTSGLKPETIENSARGAMEDQTAARASAMAASPNARPSLRPALDEIESASAKGAAGNSDMSHLAPMHDQLTTPRPGFAGATQGNPLTISELQDPQNFLALRQRFGNDFTKFDHARPLPSETMNVGNRAYHQLTDEFHRAVPGTAEPDANISNLAPVAESSAARKLNAPPLQRMVARFAPHTGAMAGMIAGGMTHGIPGAIAGLAVPEILASPTVQAAAARGLNAAGNGIGSPVGRALATLPNASKPLKAQQ